MPSPGQPAPRLSVLIALSALAVLPINLFVPSLPAIAAEFGVGFAVVNIAVAGYAVATAFVHLVAGALSDRYGRRPVALVALALFTVASIGCAAADSIGVFLACRLLQASVIAGYAVSLAAIRDTSSDREAASRIGYVSSAWALAPMLGPTVGGLLDAHFGWRSSFVAFALLGAGGLLLATAQLRETHLRRTHSLVLQLAGYRELLGSARFCAYALCMALSIGTLYVFIGGAPLVAARLGETSTVALGVYMGMVPAGFMAGSFAVGRIASRHAATRLIVAGRVLACSGLLLGLAAMALGVTNPLAFFGPCMALGLGNGLTMPAANARVLAIRPGLAGTASGLAASLTVVGAGGVAFAAGAVVDAGNAHVAVPRLMLAASLLSLAAAAFIARVEKASPPAA